ncbi:MAG: YidC/Oxa1 family membrane protein insertase [Eubacteriales bacterium]|nr:YidC/Oxa1 family membrane protein insertase [Eubacteriales bacterium]
MDYLVLTKVQGAFMGPISQVLGWIMNGLFQFTSAFGVMNIGLSIILFTLVVKILMFPMTIKQQKSSKLMAVMQPELQAIQNKYKGKKDNDSMMKMNVETKAVYEKYGTSMTGGCLQLVIQLPIMLALYRVIYSIPAYVTQVKEYFMQVVYAITGTASAEALGEGAAANLMQFATDHNITLTGINAIGDLTGVTGETLANKMVDILYKLNPAQWVELGKAFPGAADVIASNSVAIERMNSFFGINLATNPWEAGFSAAWIIPVLAGLSQWYSSRLMMSNQPKSQNDDNNMSAQMMKQMNVVMPLMSVWFCFTFPTAIGIYWVASSVFMILQQLVVNAYLNRVDMDELIRRNVEKANKKREKKGLPPQKINQNATASLKSIQAAAEREQSLREQKMERTKKQVEESSRYYNADAKPGSLAAKANMVAKYNEKHNK